MNTPPAAFFGPARCRLRRLVQGAVLVPVLASSLVSLASAQDQPPRSDVRQLISFHFLPGRADSGLAIYERVLVPAYRENVAMRRFRGFREAESPAPLDLLVATHVEGMEGMEASNSALRALTAGGRPIFSWYAALSEIAESHRDEFAEMLPELGDPGVAARDSSAGLVVVERVRILAGERAAYERLVRARVRAVERARTLARWSETGRFLVSDEWDYVRFIAIPSLAGWQRYRDEMEKAGAWGEIDRLVVARKTTILRQVPTLSVR